MLHCLRLRGLRVNRSSARDAEATLGFIDRGHYRTFTEERVGLALLRPRLAAAILGFLDARNADSMSQIQTMRRGLNAKGLFDL